MNSANPLRIKCIRVEQPIGELYIGAVPAADLLSIARADVREKQDATDRYNYTGTQRAQDRERLDQIAQYIRSTDATFPNAIILNVAADKYELGKSPHEPYCELTLERGPDTAKIIDGQHRLYAFEHAHTDSTFQLICTFLLEVPTPQQAFLFSLINMTQRPVAKSLVYDLFGMSPYSSPYKTAHELMKVANWGDRSALRGRIKILGRRLEDEVYADAPLITQGVFVDEIAHRICPKELALRETDAIRKAEGDRTVMSRYDETRYIFSEYFRSNEDHAISKIVTNYFNAVASTWEQEWEDHNSYLGRSIGFRALMRLLDTLYLEGREKKTLNVQFFQERLRPARQLKFPRSGDDAIPGGTRGETAIFEKLHDAIS